MLWEFWGDAVTLVDSYGCNPSHTRAALGGCESTIGRMSSVVVTVELGANVRREPPSRPIFVAPSVRLPSLDSPTRFSVKPRGYTVMWSLGAAPESLERGL